MPLWAAIMIALVVYTGAGFFVQVAGPMLISESALLVADAGREPQDIKLTFVDLPQEPPEMAPPEDTTTYSDRDRRAAGGLPGESPPENDLPRSTGNTTNFVAREAIAGERFKAGHATQGDVLAADMELAKYELRILDLKGD